MKQKKLNNKGFSLVELIIVIAIMAVLIGLLAPQFLKYVQRTKYSTDIKNGQEIATVIQTLIADGKITTSASPTAIEINDTSDVMVAAKSSNLLGTTPVSKVDSAYKYWAQFDAKSGTVIVRIKGGTPAIDSQIYPTLSGEYEKKMKE